MYQNDFDDFRRLLADLCTSVNRPFTDDLLRVFWDDLKAVPFATVKVRAMVLRTTGKTKFASNDLRPTANDEKPMAPIGGPTSTEQLTDYVLRNFSLTPNQLRLPWQFLGQEFDAPGLDGKAKYRNGVNITTVIVPPDGDNQGYRVTLDDLQFERAA